MCDEINDIRLIKEQEINKLLTYHSLPDDSRQASFKQVLWINTYLV
jgi:hypothetical protein